MSVDVAEPTGVEEVHILWSSEGMSCDGDTISITAAGQPSIEDVLLGAIPGLPKVHLHNKVLSPTLGGEEFLKPFRAAAEGSLDAPYVFVMEGSVPNENINGEGYWSSFGNDEATGEPLTVPWWIDRLAPGSFATVAIGTRAGYYEQGDFAKDYNSPKCLVKTGCWGPVVNCNVPKRGWMGGIGGCPNVGGICIGCTMPGFPDKFMPFMDAPPGGSVSSAMTRTYGTLIRKLRGITNKTVNEEPKWRHNRSELTTGYQPRQMN